MFYRHRAGIIAGIVLGLILVAAGLGKLLQEGGAFRLKILVSPFPEFFMAEIMKAAFVWLPWIELVVGLLLIIGVAARFMSVISSVLIAGFIANNSWMLVKGLGYEPCYCFGIWEVMAKARLSTVTSLYIDIIMLALVLVVLFCYRRRFFNIYPWFLRRGESAEEDWPGAG